MVSESHHIDLHINAEGLNCPMPLLKAKQGLNTLGHGQRLQITATDPGSERDFHSFVNLSGHELVEFTLDNGVYRYVLQKG